MPFFARLILLLAVWLCAAFHAGAQQPARIEYAISLREPQTQMVDILILIRDWKGGDLTLHLPAWRPGRYQILDPAGSVRAVTATNDGDTPLDIQKTDKDSWRVATGGADAVRVRYRVYANELASRTRHVDSSHAFLSGSSVFMYAEELRAEPVVVRVEAPEGWRVSSGLAAGQGLNTLVAPNYDALVDSPLEVGTHAVHPFVVDGVPHELAVWGTATYDPATLTRDFATIVKAHKDLFGAFPYPRYVFILHLAAGVGGGTKHINSTVIQARPTVFDTPKAYRSFLGLVSHEFFHTWNVKQFRPAGLKPYDYAHENYTTLLWVSEGTTTYYEDLLLTRCGLIKPKHFLDGLAASINAERARPGLLVQSLEESSFDSWIKHNRASPDSVNSTVSFYSKGALVNLLLDLELRQRTDNTVSLDHVMRELYRKFPLSGPGFRNADLLGILLELSGSDFEPFFRDYVRATTPLPLEASLAFAGLELVPKEPGDDDEKDDPVKARAYVGLNLKDADGAAVVSSVLADGPAYKAGVIAEDHIIALNGRRLRAADLEARLKTLAPGDPIRLVLLRRDELKEVDFVAVSDPNVVLTLRRVKEPTDSQRAIYTSWLGQEWPADKPADDKDGGAPAPK